MNGRAGGEIKRKMEKCVSNETPYEKDTSDVDGRNKQKRGNERTH